MCALFFSRPQLLPPRFRHQSGLGDPRLSPYRALSSDTPALCSIPCDPVDHPTSPFYTLSTVSLLRRDSRLLSPRRYISISQARVVPRELSRSLSQTRTMTAAVTWLLVIRVTGRSFAMFPKSCSRILLRLTCTRPFYLSSNHSTRKQGEL